MKTYIVSLPDKLKKISEKINFEKLLCDRSWIVFNDEGVKIVYIFQDNFSLIVSKNGVIHKAKWGYISANKSVMIEDNGISLMLHPLIIDDVICILQQDGTDGNILLIDEKKKEYLADLSIKAINYYINKSSMSGKTIKEIEREREYRRKREEIALRIKIKDDYKEEIKLKTAKYVNKVRISLIMLISILAITYIAESKLTQKEFFFCFLGVALVGSLCCLLWASFRIVNITESIVDDKIKEYKSKNQ